MEIVDFIGCGEKNLALYIWDKVDRPKAVLQIVHGMCEHMARYDDFAEYLNKAGIIVAGNDQRGHGKSSQPENYGYEEGDMWENNVADQKLLSVNLKEKYNLPLIIMGHSYGSFLAQRQAEINPLPDAFIFSGSNFMKSFLFSAGAVLSKMQCKKKGERAAGHLMSDMSFKSYEKRFPGTNNWLSKEEENVKKYNDDPACGYVASNNFYFTFMKGIKKLYLKEEGEKINLDKPIYLFAGGDDPVGDYGKGVVKLYNWYKKLGVKRLEMKLYQGLRHETLNEKQGEVYEDTLNFIKSVFEGN